MSTPDLISANCDTPGTVMRPLSGGVLIAEQRPRHSHVEAEQLLRVALARLAHLDQRRRLSLHADRCGRHEQCERNRGARTVRSPRVPCTTLTRLIRQELEEDVPRHGCPPWHLAAIRLGLGRSSSVAFGRTKTNHSDDLRTRRRMRRESLAVDAPCRRTAFLKRQQRNWRTRRPDRRAQAASERLLG